MAYSSDNFLKVEDITVSEETRELMKVADKVYRENFDGETWFGRCLFLSYYCALGDCTFCYRSTIKKDIESPPTARRTIPSVLVESLFCKKFDWKIEFLTGGIGIFPFNTILEIMDYTSRVYGKKVWVNLGLFSEFQMKKMLPYVDGICASVESVVPGLHDKVAPSKPLDMYSNMLKQAKAMGYKTSIAAIVGLGESREDFNYLFDFIKDHELDRVIMFPLKPIRGTVFTKGPSTDEFLWWLSKLRIEFPKLEIISGSNLRRSEELGYAMQTGANAFGKFPASKYFGRAEARKVKELIESTGRKFMSNITDLPDIDWEGEIDSLDLPEDIKLQMKVKIQPYLRRFKRNTNDEVFVVN